MLFLVCFYNNKKLVNPMHFYYQKHFGEYLINNHIYSYLSS